MQITVKPAAGPWKIMLMLLVGVFLVGTAASLYTAAHRGSRVVDADYYNHGLHYGQTGTGAKNAGMAWTMSASVAGGQLQVKVRDESGAPVAGGKLDFVPEQRGTAPRSTLALTESAPGVFSAERPSSDRGELHGTLHFALGDAVASHKLVLFD